MKRNHAGSSGLHNPFGVAASQMKPRPAALAAPPQPQQVSAGPSGYSPHAPAPYMPPPPAFVPAPQPYSQSYYPPPLAAYNMPPASAYNPQQPHMFPPAPPPMPFYGPQQPPNFQPPMSAGQSYNPMHAHPHGGPPNKRVRYEHKGRAAPPLALPPLSQPSSSAPPLPPNPPPFNPGPPPPHLVKPPSSGKAPLPPQSAVRPNNPSRQGGQGQQPPRKQRESSAGLPSNPALPPRPANQGNSSTPAVADHDQSRKRRERDRPVGSRRSRAKEKQRARNQPNGQQPSALPSAPAQSQREGTPSTPKSKNSRDKMSLTDFRITGLDMQFDGQVVWTWRAEPEVSNNQTPSTATQDEAATEHDDKPAQLEAAPEAGRSVKAPVASAEAAEVAATSVVEHATTPLEAHAADQQATTAGISTPTATSVSESTEEPPAAQLSATSANAPSEAPLTTLHQGKHRREEEEDDQITLRAADEDDQHGRSRNKKLRADSPARHASASVDEAAGGATLATSRLSSRLRICFCGAKAADPASRDLSLMLKRRPAAASVAREEENGEADEPPADHSSIAPPAVSQAQEEEDVDGAPVELEALPDDAPEQQLQTSVARLGSTDQPTNNVAHTDTPDQANDEVSLQAPEGEAPEDRPTPNAINAISASAQEPSGFTDPSPAQASIVDESLAVSAERLSISYADNTRRLMIDAAVVEELKIFRADGRIECSVVAKPATRSADGDADNLRVCQGVVVEELDGDTSDYLVVERQQMVESSLKDPFGSCLTPPLASLLAQDEARLNPDNFVLVAYLDKAHALSEPRWVRSGEMDAWALPQTVSSTPSKGGQLPPADSSWRGKLCVVDPDPPPSLLDIAKAWAEQHGELTKRSRARDFVDQAFANVNNIVELMLCLIRGGDLPPSRAHPTTYRQPQVADLFARAISLGAPQPSEQSSLSLATYAMFKLAIDHGVKAGLSQDELHAEVCEIVRQLPTSMLHKAMEAQFNAWSATN